MQHPDAALARRNEVLRAMLLRGYITQNEFSRAAASPLAIDPGTLYSSQRHPNFFGWATQQLAALPHFGQRQVELGGLKVRTTLDTRLQPNDTVRVPARPQ